ncbi:MAG: VCBS repeat-containing protein, partial [Planctomycetota bacterium]|nr:VCBS repeat-containing protein [Planctomycetota bacterium]
MRLLGLTAALAGLLAAACGSGAGPGQEPTGSGPSASSDLGAFRLLARRELPVDGKPTGLLAADLDGDGHAELVALTRSPGGLHLWKGTPNGIAPRARTVPVGDYPLGPLRLGASTIGFASQAEAKLYVADARRAAADALRTVDLPATPRALAAGDLGADGSLEIAVATVANEVLVYRVGDSSLELVASHALPSKLSGRPTAMHVLRDGSGLVLGSQITRELIFLSWETLLGEPQDEDVVLALHLVPRAAVEADVDHRHGDLELVVAGGDSTLWVYGWDTPGGARAWLDPDGREPVTFDTLGTTPIDLEVADLDGDGRDELVLINSYDSGYAVLGGLDPSLPGGAALRLREYAGQWPRACAVADLDGDGRADLAVANRDSRSISLLSGTGLAEPGKAAFSQAFRTPVGRNPTRVVAADLDGDELPELLVINAGEKTLVVRVNEGGFVRERGPRFPVEPGPRALVSGDFDGDGHADAALLLLQAGAARLAVFYGDGEGGLRRRDGPVVAAEGSDLLAANLFGDARD